VIPTALYPLRFEPIYQYRIWGGRRLAKLLSAPLPGDGPIGEAWLLSDRDDHPSVVADGPCQGVTLGTLLARSPEQMLGKHSQRFRRFPLLLKFLDVKKTLSVQVHPADEQKAQIPAGESGKTEAWVVMETGTGSRIFAGLKPGTTKPILQQALADGTVADCLASFNPSLGDNVLIPAGTVHALQEVVVFEVQENSDVTYRLYDWNHIDARTGQPRPLQVKQAMACVDFNKVALEPAAPVVESTTPVRRERLIVCPHFGMWRCTGDRPFSVGLAESPRVLVCLGGHGHLEHSGAQFPFTKGDVLLLPASVGACLCQPDGMVTMLEVSLPEEA
jgi:mannose-6-phosphate isomerase